MNNAGATTPRNYREQILSNLTPVRPLRSPSRRAWMLVPVGLALAATAPLLAGQRGDLEAYAPLATWGFTGSQTLLGLWLLALAFREAVPGRNVSRRALVGAATLSLLLVTGVTVLTNSVSPTVVPRGVELRFWAECVIGPMVLGAPFMLIATLMAVRAFPTRPAIAGALSGLSAGMLTDAGWRLSCWISEPSHVIGSHGLAMLGLAAAGALLAVAIDWARWKRLRSGT